MLRAIIMGALSFSFASIAKRPRNFFEGEDEYLHFARIFAITTGFSIAPQTMAMISEVLHEYSPYKRIRYKKSPITTSNKVALLIVGEDGTPPVHRDIVIYPRDIFLRNTIYHMPRRLHAQSVIVFTWNMYVA